MEDQTVFKIDGSSFSADLSFSNDKLVSFSIEYNGDEGKFTINGADIVISIGNYHYIPEKKDLLEEFNETIKRYLIADADGVYSFKYLSVSRVASIAVLCYFSDK